MSPTIGACGGAFKKAVKPEALLITCISTEQCGYLHARHISVREQEMCLVYSFKSMAICEDCDLNTSWLSTALFQLLFYTVVVKITSSINETESTISLFQSSLVSLLSVNELWFRHRYQQRSLFNYSYRACLPVCHCCLESFFP